MSVLRKRRVMPVVLALSLAVNLAVIAAVAGVALRTRGEPPGARADVRFGAPYIRALPPEQRDRLRASLRGSKDRDRIGRPMGFEQMLQALRAAPFDPAAVQAALEAQRTRSLDRVGRVTDAWLALVIEMTDAQRAAYAERLEETLARRGRDRARK
ncbi:periplasmic heavy metal sensor [Sulfitobacter sp. S190]|uniref:periplasmic heavy metal sensor n=1 Tax=Sulfitobacter sp. S190 TaxID=2867022 RepID=UPI0021A768E3|nr:periplasmic heavy metal sensor [Sulfitobacter sp. S190]UWR23501.1 periplasmic heavy metal sensor [Sulfitobacter sp. S190]